MNLAMFFNAIRHTVFGGNLTQKQVDGISRILEYAEGQFPGMADKALAYIFATVTWETGREMQPISERGGYFYLRRKPYWPWYGRGLVQITWRGNYHKFGITNPDDALKWETALDVAFRGMITGMFTGKKLSDFFDGDKLDFYNARTIINGHDKAGEIAAIALSYLKAFELAKG